MACKGQVVLANYLSGLSAKKGRTGYDVEIELELLKCLKKSLGNMVSCRTTQLTNLTARYRRCFGESFHPIQHHAIPGLPVTRMSKTISRDTDLLLSLGRTSL